MGKVSVIMNGYNCAKYVGEAIESVLGQTYKDYEIIFWDNQSSDHSDSLVLSYGGPIRYFRGEKFFPLGAARNEAIKQATGEYIAFLDCDDIWLPQKLEKQMALLDGNPSAGMVYSDFYAIDKDGQPLENCVKRPKLYRGKTFEQLINGSFILFSSVVVRKSVLDKIGYFDTHFNIAEDMDFLLRLTYKYEIDYVDAPMVKYRIHESNWSKKYSVVFDESYEIFSRWLNDTKTDPATQKLIRDALLYTCLKFAFLEAFKKRDLNGAFSRIKTAFSIFDNNFMALTHILSYLNTTSLRKLALFLRR